MSSTTTIETPYVSLIFGTPFLRIQTILQTQDLIPSLKFNPVKGVLDCFKRIKREEGFRFLWRGGLPYFLYSIGKNFQDASTVPLSLFEVEVEEIEETDKLNPKDGLNSLEDFHKEEKTSIDGPDFVGNSEEKNTGDKIHEKKTIIVEGAGEDNELADAGLPLSIFIAACNIIMHPFEVLRVRMGTDFIGKEGRQYTGMFNAGSRLMKSEGIRALYRGFIPTTLLMLIQQNLFFFLAKRDFGKDYVYTGMGFLLETLLYPLIVVSSRMMMWPDNPLGKYRNMRECFQGTYKEFGVRGFYKGFQLTVLFNVVVILVDNIPDVEFKFEKKDSV